MCTTHVLVFIGVSILIFIIPTIVGKLLIGGGLTKTEYLGEEWILGVACIVSVVGAIVILLLILNVTGKLC